MASTHVTPIEALLRERLSRDGRMTFAEFMELALFEPELGYYATQAVLGAEGDYVTSPELHPAFGALLGRQLEDAWRGLGCPSDFGVREVGAGSGVLCRDILRWAASAAPELAAAASYEIVERSAALRRRQQATLEQAGLAGQKITWVAEDAGGSGEEPSMERPAPYLRTQADAASSVAERPPSERSALVGCILSNELLDSFPVHLVVVRDGRLLERYVALEGERFFFVEDRPSTPALERHFADLGVWPGEGCLAEVNLAAVGWMARAAARLRRGLMLTIDYGYPASELYAPSRRHGTLLCYYRHTLSSDPLARVGRQDITTHVDFTSLARTAERHGVRTIALLSQARVLVNLGLADYLARMQFLPEAERAANQRALRSLIDPGGLGRVGVLLQHRGMDDYVPVAARESAGTRDDAYLPALAPGGLRMPGPEDVEPSDGFLEMWKAFVSGDESHLDA